MSASRLVVMLVLMLLLMLLHPTPVAASTTSAATTQGTQTQTQTKGNAHTLIHSALLPSSLASAAKPPPPRYNRRRARTGALSMHELPGMDDIDSIELYHLRSFTKQTVRTSGGIFSLQTSGLALRSTTTNRVVVLEYRPADYDASYLPRLKPVSAGSGSGSGSGDGDSDGAANETEREKETRETWDLYNTTDNIYWDTSAVITYSTYIYIHVCAWLCVSLSHSYTPAPQIH